MTYEEFTKMLDEKIELKREEEIWKDIDGYEGFYK